MGKDAFEITVNVVKMFAIFLLMVQMVPILVWVERRGSAFIQNRLGPNRVGPLGLMQLLADAVKFLFKEEFFPQKGVKLMYYGAPVVALIPGALAFASIPLSCPIAIEPFQMFGQSWGPYTFLFQGYELGIGIVFVLGISSLGAYSLLMAGWGSANKYSLLGALRASAQMISYELALSLSLVGILMIYG
ncbi:MAG: complex I subunit 1 family protein, partial [Bdellovibrionota bacterium]